ncbi:MAG: Bug family tripartite tricarboxylate transporter substrate binding protein [Rhodospirillales bacterium]
MPTIRAALLAAALAVGLALPASADDAAFYSGKTVRIICGFGEGGGYDLYARFAAEHLGKFIPGKPTVIVQNMTGAGSKRAAKYVYSVAPKDGTVLGIVSQSMPHDAVTDPSESDYDVNKFTWIGRLNANVDVGVSWHTSAVKTLEDAKKRQAVVGATGATSPSVQVPKALNAVIGTQFKIVQGYKGSAEISLAMERGEVDMVSSIGLPGIKSTRPQWLSEKKVNFIYQTAVNPHPELPGVPTVGQLGNTPEEKAILRFVASSADLGRYLLGPPEMEASRLATLRKAFADMMADAGVQADAAKRNLDLSALPPDQLAALAADVMATPKPVVERIKAIFEAK